jgi:hypothetical protein
LALFGPVPVARQNLTVATGRRTRSATSAGVSNASMYSSWCLSNDTKNNIIAMVCCNPH